MYSEQTIFIISHIIVSEALEANIEAVDTHMNGMKKIIDAVGGMDMLEHGTLAMLYSCQYLRGIMSNSMPVLDMCAKFQSRVLRESAFFRSKNRFTESSSLGTRFFTASWSRDIQPTFKSIISSYQQLISYYESFANVDVEPMSVENDCLLFLGYRLISLPYEVSLTPFEETLRLSIMTYNSVRIWALYGIPCLERLVDMLRISLFTSLSALQSTAPDLLFWIFFVGSLASKSMKHHSWFVAHLTDVADQLSLQKWDRAVGLLEKFFFVCRPSDEPAKDLWQSTFRPDLVIVQENRK
ncbi:hypothetical protein N7508_006786 [Penicillium antarcticum]|uniref:uncharacterized protein n=1 Tax=Penicillium antarcticum TaxID=416450 RepID=UPI002398B80B|nr:uncharacterized protein N7508_006786 [Penicillium antarcticum]KAJ5301923.1 hypothetical protein N7508_006786 [Penicillium antarcticum]